MLLEFLRFEEIDSRKDTIKNAHARTCQWLLRHTKYKTWNENEQRSQHHGFLWISGKPGAGKSTIMKFAFQKMKSTARLRKFIAASFFFNARGAMLEKSVLGMYRSLLLQLLEGYPDLQAVLDNPDLVSPNQDKCPPLDVLKELLFNAIMDLHDRPFVCFIDALDECDEQQALDMVRYFEELAEESTSKGIPFRVCFSSRHYPYIVIKRGIRLTLEDQPGHADDMEAYVKSHLRVENDILCDELRQEILNKAAGVFMWTVLVVQIVNGEEQRGGLGPKERLAELPSDLSKLFKNIIQRDAKNVQHLVLTTLLILYAKRPLHPDEFRHALSFGLHQKGVAVDWPIANITSLDRDSRAKTLEKCVVGCSKGLAEVTKSTKPTVQFIHESVRDFLIKDKGLLELCADLGVDFESSGHDRLKQCCYAYLNDGLLRSSVDELEQSGDISKEEKRVIQEKYPFLKYATQHVLHHANAAAKGISQDEFLSNFSIPNWARAANIFKQHKIRRYTPNASMLYILADGGHSKLIRTRPKGDLHLRVPGERYKYVLFAALANSNSGAVAALFNLSSNIHNGVDITQGFGRAKDLRCYEKRTPLSWAAQEGRIEMVDLLLQSGAPVDEKDARDRTPLSCACETGMGDIVRLLIRHGADVNARNTKGESALGWACLNSRLNVAKFLIKKGATVDIRDMHDETPLFRTARNCDERIARILIDNGADLNALDKKRNTPLFVVARRYMNFRKAYRTSYANDDLAPREPAAICNLLLDHGADINAINNDGRTPLSTNLKHYHQADVARLLIAKRANVNTRDKTGRTPLSFAVSFGDAAITELLLENGADPNIGDLDGLSPLHEAAFRGSVNKCILLIRHGARVNSRDKLGETPLSGSTAFRKGAGRVVKFLLENGANPNIGDSHGSSPLHQAAAALRGNVNMCKLLIENGADLNAKDQYGSTPLHRAARYGLADKCMLLIEHGAEPNARDKNKSTPLHAAARDGYADVCMLLVENGAEVDIKRRDGLTPIDVAAEKGHQAVADMMMQNGAGKPTKIC